MTLTAHHYAVLRAVAHAEGSGRNTTIDVANALGRDRPDLLNSRRERLMTELRRAGAIDVVRRAGQSGWTVTAMGRRLLSDF